MYTGRTFNRESVYVCGDYMDGDIYPVFQPPGKRRSRCKPTSEIQQKLNQKNAEKKLTRLVHSNFTEDDIALHLTYRPGEEPQTEEEAQHILSNYIRRLKPRYLPQLLFSHSAFHVFGLLMPFRTSFVFSSRICSAEMAHIFRAIFAAPYASYISSLFFDATA